MKMDHTQTPSPDMSMSAKGVSCSAQESKKRKAHLPSTFWCR